MANAYNQYATNKYNTDYNEYNSQYLLNQISSNGHKATLSNLLESTDNLALNSVYFKEEPKNNFLLSDFTLLSEIGKGSEGIIYVARWKRNNKNYALKKYKLHYQNVSRKERKIMK